MSKPDRMGSPPKPAFANMHKVPCFSNMKASIFDDKKEFFWDEKLLLLNEQIKINILNQYKKLEKQREEDDIAEYMNECYLTHCEEYESDFDVRFRCVDTSEDEYDCDSCEY